MLTLQRSGLALLAAAACLLAATPAAHPQTAKPSKTRVDRGQYLVKTGACGDCHSPKVFGPQGPVEHPTLALSGHQAGTTLPQVPSGVIAPDKWGAIASSDLTAWVGPWGISFAANLTPDPATGIGAWTEERFLSSMRRGKHLGNGRPILPPMPWQAIGQMSDQDLKDMFAYLMSLKPIENKVPEPTPPGR